MHTYINEKIKKVTEYTERFFNLAEQGNYNDAITNSRKLAETICKLLVFKDIGRDRINFNGRNKLIEELMLKDLSEEIKRFISDNNFHQEIEYIRKRGNDATHADGCTEQDFEVCEPKVKFLVEWLFQHLNLPLPLEIKEIFEKPYKPLKIFKPLPSVLKVDRAGKLFENQLVYFPEPERQQINIICNNLQQNQHFAFLQGQPAKGKTVTTFEIGRQMENAGWKVYYYSFKNTKESCLVDIKENLYRKYLFIIDDCHLDVETMFDIYYQIHDRNYTVALLFVSRILTEDFEISSKHDFNLFEILEEVTFKQSESSETKIAGITQCYQTFYQQLQNKEYLIDNIDNLTKEIKGNLVALSLYLDQWKQVHSLSKVDRKTVLKDIHLRYIKPLDERSKTCLLKYACLFYFEIKFETLPHYELETDALAKLGIIENQSKNIYGFYHSEFAHLLLEAFISQDHTFYRKYKNLDNFIAANLKNYLLAFKQENYYPLIISNLFVSLANSKPALLQQLFLDVALQPLFLDYYQESESKDHIWHFIRLLSKHFPDIFMSIFSHLLQQNDLFHHVAFETDQSLALYWQFLINLKNNLLNYQQFLDQYGDKKLTVFKLAKLNLFASSLVVWKKYINDVEAEEILESFDNQILIEKIQQADFTNIGNALNELNQVNPQKAAALFNSIDNQLLIDKIQQHNFSDIGEGLNRLNKVNPQKAADLFNSIDNQLLIDKIQEITFNNIGYGLNTLNQVNPQKTKEIFELIDTKLLAEKAQQGRLGFLQIANPFSQLHQINVEKTHAVFKLMQEALPINEWLKEILKRPSRWFIYSFGIFALLDKVFAKNIIEQLPDNYLFHQQTLKEIKNYNKLLYWLWLMEFDMKYPLIQKLVKFGQTNLHLFLLNKNTKNVGSFLRLLNNYVSVKPILEKEYSRLIGKMLFEEDKQNIPKYITIIHEIDEQIGLDFLKTFQEKKPELIEQLVFSYLYIGENYQQQNHISKAEQFFNQAEPLLKQLNHLDGLTFLSSLREKFPN